MVLDLAKAHVMKDDTMPNDAHTDIDLAWLTRQVSDRLGAAPTGYVPGRTKIRDAVTDILGCSMARAERLVAELEARRFIHYPGRVRTGVDEGLPWQFQTPAKSP